MIDKTFRVVDDRGFIGTLRAPARFLDSRTEKVIDLNSGEKLTVKAEDLKVQQDGTFLLVNHPANSKEFDEPQLEPIRHDSMVHETAGVGAPVMTTPAVDRPASSIMAAESGIPGGSFYADDYEIERVPIGRLLDTPAQSRQEGDTLVLPVLEEVLVYQKKILLKEEVRITRRRQAVGQVKRIDDVGNAKA